MDQISLYRKYRPHNFDNLVGQDHLKTILINALKSGHVAHAYLFTGPRGTGKTSTARLVAKALLCSNLTDEFEPCNECDFCKDISEGRLIDMIEIDAASNRGIDEVRDLREKIKFAPTRAKYKIYIIDEVHMMTKEAFNALLKTLEEPPSHAYFILATTEAHKIPETIISRCQRFDFRRISNKVLMTRLSYIAQKEGIEAEDRALEAISKYVDGGLRDAIGLLEQLTTEKKLTFAYVQEILGVSDFSLLDDLYNHLMQNNTQEAINLIHELHDQGSDLRQFVHEFVELLRQKMLQSVGGEQKELTGRLMEMIEILQKSNQRLDSSIPQLALEIAVIEICGAFSRENPPVMVKEQKSEAEVKPEVRHEIKAQEQAKVVTEDRTHQPLENIELNMAVVTEKWPRIVERIKTPALRMSLRNCSPIKIENSQIYLEFETNFHREKVMESANRAELELVMKDFFGVGVKIVGSVKALEIKPVIQERSQNDDLDKALNIFGGELV